MARNKSEEDTENAVIEDVLESAEWKDKIDLMEKDSGPFRVDTQGGKQFRTYTRYKVIKRASIASMHQIKSDNKKSILDLLEKLFRGRRARFGI